MSSVLFNFTEALICFSAIFNPVNVDPVAAMEVKLYYYPLITVYKPCTVLLYSVFQI